MRTATMVLLTLGLAAAPRPVSAQSLDIYFIDTEGGQATLFVSPSGESLLVDTGNPGERDHRRIMEVVKVAGLRQIDHLWITHYHTDHYGGLEALAQALPIRHFYDHGPSADIGRAATDTFMAWYAELAGSNRRSVKPGERIPFAGVDMVVAASHTALLEAPMAGAPGAGDPNPHCEAQALRAPRRGDDEHSAGFVLSYGAFRTINLGDLSWNFEHDLMCPTNPIGTVSLYATSYHGSDRGGSPALVYGLQARVAIMNNGSRKGGSIEPFETLWRSPYLEDLWQLHWSHTGGIEYNAPGRFVANLDSPEILAGVVNPAPAPVGSQGALPASGAAVADAAADHRPAHWIKVSARRDGSFTVTNSRNRFSKTYAAR